MTAIDPTQPIVTLINVFSVTPDNADKLVTALASWTEDYFRSRPGFISANLHRSLDGTKVVNYAQWRSVQDFQAMLSDPKVQEHFAEANALAERIEPTLYEVASTHHV